MLTLCSLFLTKSFEQDEITKSIVLPLCEQSTNRLLRRTVLPEIFMVVLFSLNFMVGVGPRKLNARRYSAYGKVLVSWIYYHLMQYNFVDNF